MAKQAAALARDGKLALAAQMFHAAFDLNPSAWGYLYSAARAEHLAGDASAARRDYARYLAGAPADHPVRARAARYAKALAPPRPAAPASVEKPEKPPPRGADPAAATTAPKPAASEASTGDAGSAAPTRGSESGIGARADGGLFSRRTAGWAALGAGAVGAAVGGWLLADALGRSADLEGRTSAPAGEKIVGISHAEAQDEAAAIAMDTRISGAVVGVGVALAATGGWGGGWGWLGGGGGWGGRAGGRRGGSWPRGPVVASPRP